MRILAISDSDSYLKWALSLLDHVPDEWAVRHVVLDNVIAPSPAQVSAARKLAPWAPVQRGSLASLPRRLRYLRPDAILLACTGPALQPILEVMKWSGLLGKQRPALVTGLPGISWPANDLAILNRRGVDAMILHSHREVRAYAEISERLNGPELALATLPFLSHSPLPERHEGDGEAHDVVFAAQALVPAEREQRLAILRALSELPDEFDPVVKVRALAGERQAHNEALPYADLASELPAGGRQLSFRAGAMSDALADAAGFVTVSSTAALEAIAMGVPSLVLDEFGVAADLINEVFVGSGLLGGLDELRAGAFRQPEAAWLEDNYFHPASDDSWLEMITELVAQREAEGLPPIDFKPTGKLTERARRHARVLPPAWVWNAANSARSRRRRR